jgi:ABC-type Fe3+ transport system permease subunit
MDGASRWQQFLHITLPGLKPMIYFGVTLSVIGGLQLFEEPFILTGGRGGTDQAGMTAAVYLYRMAFDFNDFGGASAMSWLLCVVVALLTWPPTAPSSRAQGGRSMRPAPRALGAVWARTPLWPRVRWSCWRRSTSCSCSPRSAHRDLQPAAAAVLRRCELAGNIEILTTDCRSGATWAGACTWRWPPPLLTLLFCSLAGYAFALLEFRFKKALVRAVMATMLLPSFMNMIPSFMIMDALGWIDQHRALYVPGAASAFGIFMMRQFALRLCRAT